MGADIERELSSIRYIGYFVDRSIFVPNEGMSCMQRIVVDINRELRPIRYLSEGRYSDLYISEGRYSDFYISEGRYSYIYIPKGRYSNIYILKRSTFRDYGRMKVCRIVNSGYRTIFEFDTIPLYIERSIFRQYCRMYCRIKLYRLVSGGYRMIIEFATIPIYVVHRKVDISILLQD